MVKNFPGEEWTEYYDQFPYFSHESIRQGCHPWKMIKTGSEKAIVLIHGLSDSPYYMMALASFFHDQLNYSVFVPLLQSHGLKNPDGMNGVSRKEWRENVAYSIETASQCGTVSIGGLSTGATLALYAMESFKSLDSPLYLFSAAFALSGGLIGRLKEHIIRTKAAFILKFFDRKKNLIGKHPFRYAYVDREAARQLVLLMKEVALVIAQYDGARPYLRPVFAVHCEADRVVSFEAVEDFYSRVGHKQSVFLPLPSDVDVTHAGVVLQQDIISPNDQKEVLENANPQFAQLLEQIAEMERSLVNSDETN